MGKIGNTLTRYGSIDGTLEWYQEIKYLVESPDIKEIAFKGKIHLAQCSLKSSLYTNFCI